MKNCLLFGRRHTFVSSHTVSVLARLHFPSLTPCDSTATQFSDTKEYFWQTCVCLCLCLLYKGRSRTKNFVYTTWDIKRNVGKRCKQMFTGERTAKTWSMEIRMIHWTVRRRHFNVICVYRLSACPKRKWFDVGNINPLHIRLSYGKMYNLRGDKFNLKHNFANHTKWPIFNLVTTTKSFCLFDVVDSRP